MKTDITKPLALKAALKNSPTGRAVEVTDTKTPGLSARVRRLADGTIVGKWNARITINRDTTRVSLGDINEMNGLQARLAAMQAREAIRAGQTVLSASTAAREAQSAAATAAEAEAENNVTLGELLLKGAPDRPSYRTVKWDNLKSGREAMRMVKNVWGDLLDQPARSITKTDMEQVFLKRADTAPQSASRALAYIRPALIHWMKRGMIERDILDLVEDHKQPIRQRQRVLTPHEWGSVWNATTTMAEARPFPAMAVKLLMMTGARKNEIARMEINHIDLDKSEVHIPSEASKNGDPHIVCLNDTAIAVVREALDLREATGATGKYVFSNDGGKTPVYLGSQIKAAIDEISGVTGWVVHDLRRSWATHLAESGITAEVVDLSLNHRASASRGGITAVYNKSLRLPERRAAAAKWGEITHRWLTGESAKVVQIT